MSRRNLTVLFVALAIGLLCYARSERNPYARYVGHAYELVDDLALEQPSDRELFAGAMQGMQLGIPAVAFSQARGFRSPDEPIPWETAETYGPGVLHALLKQGWPQGVVMNVNFPDLPPDKVKEVEVTFQGFRDQHIVYADRRTDLRGQAYYWLGFHGKLSNPPDGSDLRAIYEGRISVTPLHLDLTNYSLLESIRNWDLKL